MKLLLKQYLSSLNERDELDVVLPDIMSEVGFNVISRPKRGTTQFGVDVAAIGKHPETGKKAMFLLSIKSGDLTRNEWDVGKQALRPSLNEILDVYIPRHIPKRYADLPIVVTLCFGGDIHEDVRPKVDGFTDNNSSPGKIDFAEWNGDYIAELIASGLLRENIFPKPVQSSFRKSIALVDEPSVCVTHFSSVLSQLFASTPQNLSERLRIARQIYLATWTVFVWCRDVNNLESAYQCSSLAALWVWDISHGHFNGKSKAAKELIVVIDKIVRLHRIIGAAYIEEHISPYCEIEDGLAVSVPSASSVDINIQLFEALGRVALHGIWLIQSKTAMPSDADDTYRTAIDEELEKTVGMICHMINNNQLYFTPLRDDHAIEITLTCLFLMQSDVHEFLHQWIDQITLSSIFTHRSQGKYPCVFREYSELAMHPQYSDDYQKEATIGSVLYSSLALWLALCGNETTFSHLAEFHEKDMSHSTWQFWLPDEITDDHLYRNSDIHGTSFSGLNTTKGPQEFLDQVQKEIIASTAFNNLSALNHSVGPLILMACHRYRLPVPPHFLTSLFL